MDVNSSAATNSQPQPVIPAQPQQIRAQSETRPVEPAGDPARSRLDEQKLKEREQQSRQLSGEKLAAIVEDLQKRLDAMGTRLNFSLDEKTESIVIQIKNKKTGELVRQIPSEQMLELKSKLENLLGVIFDQKV